MFFTKIFSAGRVNVLRVSYQALINLWRMYFLFLWQVNLYRLPCVTSRNNTRLARRALAQHEPPSEHETFTQFRVNSYSARIDFSRQNLTSIDVRFVAVRGWRYVLADKHPNRIRTLRKYSRIITYHYISMAYGPNHTNKFAIPHVCLYHVPTVHSCPNELYNIHGDTHATIKVTVQFEHEPYQSNGDTFDTNRLRIIQTTLRTLQYRPYKTYS